MIKLENDNSHIDKYYINDKSNILFNYKYSLNNFTEIITGTEGYKFIKLNFENHLHKVTINEEFDIDADDLINPMITKYPLSSFMYFLKNKDIFIKLIPKIC